MDYECRYFWEPQMQTIECVIGTPINGITEVTYDKDGNKTVRTGLRWFEVKP